MNSYIAGRGSQSPAEAAEAFRATGATGMACQPAKRIQQARTQPVVPSDPVPGLPVGSQADPAS